MIFFSKVKLTGVGGVEILGVGVSVTVGGTGVLVGVIVAGGTVGGTSVGVGGGVLVGVGRALITINPVSPLMLRCGIAETQLTVIGPGIVTLPSRPPLMPESQSEYGNVLSLVAVVQLPAPYESKGGSSQLLVYASPLFPVA